MHYYPASTGLPLDASQHQDYEMGPEGQSEGL